MMTYHSDLYMVSEVPVSELQSNYNGAFGNGCLQLVM